MQVYKFDLFDLHPFLSATIQFWSDPILLGVLNCLIGIQYPLSKMMFRIFLEDFDNEFNMLTNSFEGESHIDFCAQCIRMALTGGGGRGAGVGALKVYAL